jgi:hypothetical protein
VLFHKCIKKSPTEQSLELNSTWRKHLYILYAANLLIMIWSVFRLIEYVMGNNSYLLWHEVFLYIFDGLLMLLVMITLNIIHPSGLISHKMKRMEMNALPWGVLLYCLTHHLQVGTYLEFLFFV